MADFEIHTKKETLVLHDGCEIARLDGHVLVSGKDYIAQLPIEVRHITTTYQVLNITKIDEGGDL